jgi:hypothetical protein
MSARVSAFFCFGRDDGRRVEVPVERERLRGLEARREVGRERWPAALLRGGRGVLELTVTDSGEVSCGQVGATTWAGKVVRC